MLALRVLTFVIKKNELIGSFWKRGEFNLLNKNDVSKVLCLIVKQFW